MSPAPVGRFHPQFWSNRAKELYEHTIARDMIVTGEVELCRCVQLTCYRRHGQKEYFDIRAGEFKQFILNMRRMPGWSDRYKMRKTWRVAQKDRITDANNKFWDRHVMAKAYWEALNYHYARYVMAKDTPAAGYL